MPQNIKIGVVIPSYKESENIAPLVQEVLRQREGITVVVVDDSPDLLTVEAVRKLGLMQAHTIHRTSKGGRGSAVLEGIQFLLNQGCNQIVEMDSDFSHPPTQIPALLDHAQKENIDLLIASRYLPTSQILNWPLSRTLFSKFSNILAHAVLQVPIHDYTNGFRVYSHATAKLITETCGKMGKGFISLSEILVNVYFRGFKVGEVPTKFVNRLRGESSLNRAEITNALKGLWQIYLLKRKLQGDACLTGKQQLKKNG